MPKTSQILLGPELLWVLFYALIVLAIKVTGSPAKSMDPYWENLGWIVTLVFIPLTFALYWVPGVERSWLLLRVWIACVFGSNYVLEKGLGAHSEQGPGVGTIYIMVMILVLVLLVIGSIFVKIRF
jgi:hypothetical protein